MLEKFVDKFNIFDLFTMLIPGLINTSLFAISLYPLFECAWKKWGNEKIALFCVISYLCGVIFQEFGTLMDELFVNRLVFGGKPREVYLIDGKYKRIYKERLFFDNMQKIKIYFLDALKINESDYKNKELNSMIFDYCMNIAEKNNLTAKSEKMTVISEMSRSLFWGCVFTIQINKYVLVTSRCLNIFLLLEIPFLIIVAVIFFIRKIRYERYSMEELLTTIYLHINEDTLKKEMNDHLENEKA